jgi:Acetyltransferase (GNAT) domain
VDKSDVRRTVELEGTRIATTRVGMHEIVVFSGAERELLRRCQELRYRVYHGDLGLETPDLDHIEKIDVEERDPHCDFAAVLDGRSAAGGEVLGCIRMQPPDRGPFYADLEFDLVGPTWAETKLVEGARFAVTSAERNGPVPLLLFQAFRRYCRERSIEHVLSVAIIRGDLEDRGRAARLTRYLVERAERALDRGRPARGYELDPPTEMEIARAGELAAEEASPMLRLLANRRTTLCSQPAYCRRFGTFNFLLTTRLS